jgi:hypothetical protein
MVFLAVPRAGLDVVGQDLWVTYARPSVLSIITGGGKWVETICADPIYQPLLLTAEKKSWRWKAAPPWHSNSLPGLEPHPLRRRAIGGRRCRDVRQNHRYLGPTHCTWQKKTIRFFTFLVSSKLEGNHFYLLFILCLQMRSMNLLVM